MANYTRHNDYTEPHSKFAYSIIELLLCIPFFSVLPKLEIVSLQLELNLLFTTELSNNLENTGRDQLQDSTCKGHMKSNSQKK